jgi:hypothetical protein
MLPLTSESTSQIGSLAPVLENEVFSTAPFQSFQYDTVFQTAQHATAPCVFLRVMWHNTLCAVAHVSPPLPPFPPPLPPPPPSVGADAVKGSWFLGVPKRVTVNGA